MKFRAKSDSSRHIKDVINWTAINVYTERFLPDTWFTIHITRKVAGKSDPLRKYYFSTVIRTYMEHLGYESDELLLFHRQLKIVYFQVQPDKKGIYRNVPSVFSNESKIGVPDKKKFVDWVIRSAARDGCYCPDPNE